MERTLRLQRCQATVALWGGLLALVAALAAIGSTEPSMIQLPVTTLMVLLLGCGLRGDSRLLGTNLVPGVATIGWIVTGPALLAWALSLPGLATFTAMVCAGLTLWLFRRVRGGHWLHWTHTVLFAAPMGAQMDALLGLCVERVRDRSERTFPGGFSISLTPQPGIVRINGTHLQASAQLTRQKDIDGARELMTLATDEVTKALGWRAWPTGTAVCEVANDSAHTTLRRAARRAETVGFLETEGAPLLSGTAPLNAGTAA